jgi:crotonobetainyl-CoA:carnitine CoA-transferase CaiB-like acyl-CoA transferase
MNEPQIHHTALGGLRVLDLSESIAGQFCGRMLADYGAEVVLVEPAGGSAIRHVGPFADRDGLSLTFHHNNTGKSSVEIDLHGAEGRRTLADLAKASDVVLAPAGCDRAALRAANPQLIICTISPFGEDAPKSGWRASEIVYQAMSGMMNNNGASDHVPLYGVGNRASYSAGVAAYLTVLSALILRERQGIAQDVAVDVAHTAAAMCMPFTLQYSYNGSLETRGKRNQPLVEVKCRDVWMSIWIRAGHFPTLCKVLGAEELVSDPRFLTDELRLENMQALIDEIQLRVPDRNGRDLVDALSAQRLVAACAYLPTQLGPDAPHLKARQFWESAAGGEGAPILGPQFRFGRTPRPPRPPAPALGEHP